MSSPTLAISEPAFDHAKKAQPKAWYISFGAPELNADGSHQLDEKGKPRYRRARLYFSTKAAATAHRESMLLQAAATGIGPLTLDREAELEYIQAKQISRDADLRDVARFWTAHHPEKQPQKIGELIDEFVQSMIQLGRSERHLRDVRNRLNGPFRKKFGGRYPETIVRQEIVEFLKSRRLIAEEQQSVVSPANGTSSDESRIASGRTILNERNTLTNFFNFLLGKGAIKTSPAMGIRRRELPRVDVKEIEFLKLDEVKRYLRACERYAPELVAHEIVQLLAGVRADDEMADFDGSFVHASTKEVVIPASIAKTRKREVITDLEPGFWAWWKIYGREGILRPRNYGPRWERVRVLASVNDIAQADQLAALPIKTLLKRPEAKSALERWPWNARRRTFCTYHVAKHRSASRTALILRHRGSSETLHNSYRGLGVTQEMGKAYFNISPEKVTRPILPSYVPKGIVRIQQLVANGIPVGGSGNE